MKETNANATFYKNLSSRGTEIMSGILDEEDMKIVKQFGDWANSFKPKKEKKKDQNPYKENKSNDNKETKSMPDKEEVSKKKNAIPRQQPLPKTQKIEESRNVDSSTDIQKLREAIILSEVIGTPVCKRRRARRY